MRKLALAFGISFALALGAALASRATVLCPDGSFRCPPPPNPPPTAGPCLSDADCPCLYQCSPGGISGSCGHREQGTCTYLGLDAY